MINIYGIRHHGPGSALSLIRAFDSYRPDCILVEAPADAAPAIPYIGHPELHPPAAILIYHPKNLSQASYLPFATFSPEWQAMLWANRASVPIRLMDLPMSVQFGLTDKSQLRLIADKDTDPELLRLRKDPLGYLSQLAGYEDSERWWEVTFEQREGQESVFPLILSLMGPLREATKDQLAPGEALREAFMRKTIREAMKAGYQRIAVVCGAWHAPVLHDWMQYKLSADNKILRGHKKIKTAATWIPWSFQRLALQSGYGAGVISPAWYHLLFDHRQDVVVRWMSRVAQLFRAQDLQASSAHVIESVRLAEALAALRHMSIPGIQEMKEAAVSIFCEGDEDKIRLIEQQLIIGDRRGKVPGEIPVVPLQKDLNAWIKSARLTKERNSTETIDKKLDLRVPSNLKASHLLHRLLIINIPWGRETEGPRFQTGSFSEHWALSWQPEFALKIIEAGMWGNTVYDAAVTLAKKQAREKPSLATLSRLIDRTLKADLADAIEELISEFQQQSALTQDVYLLLEVLPPLINAIRYGSTRRLNVEALIQVIDQIIPRTCIGLPGSVIQIKEEVAQEVFQKLLAVNHAIHILDDPVHLNHWNETLAQIALMPGANGLLTGACTRMLFDKEIFPFDQTATLMQYALSSGYEPVYSSSWLEGFLHGSGLLLIHNLRLWNILDQWIDELRMEQLQAILPLLRRTFANFSAVERQKMLEWAKLGRQQASPAEETGGIELARAKAVVPIVKTLLGID